MQRSPGVPAVAVAATIAPITAKPSVAEPTASVAVAAAALAEPAATKPAIAVAAASVAVALATVRSCFLALTSGDLHWTHTRLWPWDHPGGRRGCGSADRPRAIHGLARVFVHDEKSRNIQLVVVGLPGGQLCQRIPCLYQRIQCLLVR